MKGYRFSVLRIGPKYEYYIYWYNTVARTRIVLPKNG